MTNATTISLTARCALTGGAVFLFLHAAAAQEAKPPAPAGSPASSTYKPGMLESVGRLFTDPYNRLGTNTEGAREAAKDAADAARGAADAVARLPKSKVVAGRKRCETAPNGAPDCTAAAASVCKAKGFASGASLDIQSTQKCPTRVWLSGRSPDPDECTTQAYVTRAMCQ